MNESNKSEIVIEYNEKEQELHHQVEKLDIVPQETDCVSEVSPLMAHTPRTGTATSYNYTMYITDLVLYGFSVQDCFNVM